MARTKKFLVNSASNSSPSFYRNIGSGRKSRNPQNITLGRPSTSLAMGKKRGRPRKVQQPEPAYWDEHADHVEPTEIVEQIKQELSEQLEEQMKTVFASASKRLDSLVSEMSRHQQPTSRPPARYEEDYEDEEDEDYEEPAYARRPASTRKSVLRRAAYPDISPQPHQSVSPIEDSQLMEKISFLEKELLAAHEREKQMKQDMSEVEQKFMQEKERLAAEMKNIKEGINPSTTPENSRFFSLSSELDQIVKAMNQLVTEPEKTAAGDSSQPTMTVPDSAPLPTSPTGSESKAESENSVQKSEQTPEKKTEEKKNDSVSTANPKAVKSKKMKKMGVAALAFVIIIGGITVAALQFMGGAAEVDPELVQNYLPAGATMPTTSPAESGDQSSDAQPAVQGISTQATGAPSPPSSDQKYAESQSEISYGETRWETYKDPTFGVVFDYPVNASNLVKTDTSITVIRMTGYIFKVQKVESALELEDYWNSIKARSLRYKIKETTFRELPALFLELEDITDYPGDRYLVKNDDYIYDVWYATPSSKLDDDDAKRVDIMLNSLQFVESGA